MTVTAAGAATPSEVKTSAHLITSQEIFRAAGARKPVIVFLGIQNLTGRRNVNGFEWNQRANAAAPLEQLGVFPLIGLEWRF